MKHHHAHDMRDTPERELPLKDAAIVLIGTVLSVLILALVTNWLLEQAHDNARRSVADVSSVPYEQPALISRHNNINRAV